MTESESKFFDTLFRHADDFSEDFFWLVVWPLFDAVNLRDEFKKNAPCGAESCVIYEFQC